MLDLDLGMNYWMADQFQYSGKPLKRGKVLTAADLERLGGFSRYKDVDGDGIGYRTLPGTKHHQAAYFTRGTGHNEKAQYSERPADWVRNMDRLDRKFETARGMMPPPVIEQAPNASIAFIACGTSQNAVEESREQLRGEHKLETSYLRVKAFPFNEEMREFVRNHERVYVVDQNRDGQLLALVRHYMPDDLVSRLRSIRYYGGLPIDARTITDDLIEQEEL
jgi:2-oxoglutarate ferredoxin oxidoreductase subunit alpha